TRWAGCFGARRRSRSLARDACHTRAGQRMSQDSAVRLPAWYQALTTLIEPVAAGWGQGGDRSAVRARRGFDVPRGDTWIHGASAGAAPGVAPPGAAGRVRGPTDVLIASALPPGGRAALLKHAQLAVTAPPYETLAAARRSVRGSGIRRLLLL